ncbi:MAG: relaxase domain-containing protein [Actinomycetota bacterium]|nr:relaxase domain-containing protein [Actinomycetota bacterium]
MSLHKLSAGDGYRYLTRQVAAADDTNRGYGTLASYYEQKGESPGVWLGSGLYSLDGSVPEFLVSGTVTEAQMTALFGEGRHPNADVIERRLQREGVHGRALDRSTKLGHAYHLYGPSEFQTVLAARYQEHNAARGERPNAAIPAGERARIRTELAHEWFRAEHRRDPLDAREFTGYLTRVSRPAPVPVAGYDLTFSPVNSVSALWAIAPRELAETIAACHDEAVRDTVGWLEKHAAYTRRATNGIAQVDTTGLIAAAFTHRDSRAGDPDLHTHVAVSNKVCTPDGRWLSLDGRALYRNKVAASEHYNTRLEALLTERIGVRFAERGDAADGKREIREIAGIDHGLLRRWSSRRGDIEAELAVLARRFQDDHSRLPTVVERQELAQQATLSTREAKHAPRSEAEQRRKWRADAGSILGGVELVDELARRVIGHAPAPTPAVDVEVLARQVIATVQGSRATWQEHHVRAEAERACRRLAAVPDFLVQAVIDGALSPANSVLLSVPSGIDEPPELRRADGSSVYEVAGSRRYTSVAILEAERCILGEAACQDFRVVESDAVDLALLEAVANGVRLGPDQAEMVRQLATSGARVQLALAPAGSGKTVTLRTLADAWAAAGNTVIGLAPTAAAARVLRDELGNSADATDTLAKLVHALTTGAAVPHWIEAIGPGSLLIVDEAGMAGTLELAAVIEFAAARGASVRLVGDDRQLAAVGAGGVLRDIDRTHGAVTLSEVRRFTHADGSTNHAEAAASLAIRRGDPAGLGYYLDHGRIHVGDDTTTADQAFTAWSADRAAGLDALLIASTNEQVRELNLRAQAARLVTGAVPAKRSVELAGGTTVSAGDVIITRRNDRRLTLSATDWVANGDRWTVTAVLIGGALEVRHARSRRRVTLPAGYVAEHVQLGYACTVHAAQGQTVDTTHAVLTGGESRQLIYVALTRGRRANSVYLDVGVGGDDGVVYADAVRPATAIEVLTRVVERDDSAVSARSTRREEREPVPLLRKACAEYVDALGVAAESVLGPEGLAQIEARAEATVPGVTDCPAWPALNSQLQRVVLDGVDADQVLRDEAVLVRRDHASDVAAILASRLGANHRETGPLPWLPPVPRQLAEDDFWGRYFDRRHELIERHGTAVRAAATSWTQKAAPAWAVPMLIDPDLTRDLATWRAARDIPDTDLRPTGPRANERAGSQMQRRLDLRVAEAGGFQPTLEPAAARLAETIHPGITADPQWPTLARQMAAADRAGIDRSELRRIATGRPLPVEQPAAALAYRLTDAIGERPTSESVPPPKSARPRPYDPAPRPTQPPDRTRMARPTPNIHTPGPRR